MGRFLRCGTSAIFLAHSGRVVPFFDILAIFHFVENAFSASFFMPFLCVFFYKVLFLKLRMAEFSSLKVVKVVNFQKSQGKKMAQLKVANQKVVEPHGSREALKVVNMKVVNYCRSNRTHTASHSTGTITSYHRPHRGVQRTSLRSS